jgi:hypothetical protein
MTAALLASHAERLRRTPWTRVARSAWAILLIGLFASMLLHAMLPHALRRLLLVAPLIPFVAKDLCHLPDALARARAALAARDWAALGVAALPPELVGILRLDGQLRRGFVSWLLRRPQPALPPGQRFGYLERGSYGTVIAIALISTLVELPLNGFIVQLFVKTAHQREVIHVLMAVACLSSLVWVLGDRWLVGKGQHVLDDEFLHLRVGARTSGSIPRHAIARCEPLTVTTDEWRRQHGIEPHRSLRASALDKPNTVLILNDNSPVRLTHMGVERTGLACVFLYLDTPQALVSALRDPPGMDAHS